MKQLIIILSAILCFGCSKESKDIPSVKTNATSRDTLICLRIPVSQASTIYSKIESDLMHKIAKKMNRKLVVEIVPLREIFVRLENGTADYSISVLNPTKAREATCNFSQPYATGGSCFLYRANEEKVGMSVASRRRIGVLSGTTSDFYLCRHRGNPKRFPTFDAARESFEKGELDAVFAVDGMVKFVERNSNGAYKTTPFEVREVYSVAVAKNRDDILAVANEIISKEYKQ